MSDPAWKKFEREFARALGARRFWANSGEALDFEGTWTYGQCKHVRRLSLAELTALAESVARDPRAKHKLGVVGVKLRQGRGRATPPLVVLTLPMFQEWFSFQTHNTAEAESPQP